MSSPGAIPKADRLHHAVALSLLRQGGSARAALVLKEMMDRRPPPDPGDPDLLWDLANEMGLAGTERTQRVLTARASAPRVVSTARQLGIDITSWHDRHYPAWLATIPDPPIVLWTRGALDLLHQPAVAVVGSRNPTPGGLHFARQLACDLAATGLVIVSGLARGVDGAAHEGALDAGGKTVAVLGSGADVIYPPQHTELAARILQADGVLVSEFVPGTGPRDVHFPLRNRIISGLARAVVVIEAHLKSGSLITARMALEQGRSVLAVPGAPMSGRSSGCHALIKDGARLVETVGDVIEEIGELGTLCGQLRPLSPAAGNAACVNDLEPVLAPGEPYALDDLCERTGRPAADLLVALSELEIAGRVRREPGGLYVRLDGSVKDSRE